MMEINLLQSRKRSRFFTFGITALFLLVISVFVYVACDYVETRRQSAELGREIRQAQAVYESMRTEWNEFNRRLTGQNYLLHYQQAVQRLKRDRNLPLFMTRAATEALPAGAVLENYRYSRNGSVHLLVRFAARAQIGDYMDRLRQNVNAKEVRLVSVSAANGTFLVPLDIQLETETDNGGEDRNE